MENNEFIISECESWMETETHSTAAQRRALYRLGMSKSFVKNYAQNKDDATVIICNSIHNMTATKNLGIMKLKGSAGCKMTPNETE